MANTKPVLSDEQRHALNLQPEGIEVEDPDTHKVYFLSDATLHRKAMQALQKQEDLESIQRGLLDREQKNELPLAEADARIRQQLGFPPRAS